MIVEQIEKNIFIPTYFTDRFKYIKEKNQFVTNISNLKNPELFTPIYKDDMSMVGFKLKSHKTGKEKIFYLTHTQKNNNDIEYWIFNDENTGKISVKINNF